jgi:restriction system protein
VRDGYAVEKLKTAGADFLLTKSSRTSLVSARRWKAASVGVQALRELQATGEQREAQECVYATLGDVSDNAGKFARDNGIRMLQGPELAVMLQAR